MSAYRLYPPQYHTVDVIYDGFFRNIKLISYKMEITIFNINILVYYP